MSLWPKESELDSAGEGDVILARTGRKVYYEATITSHEAGSSEYHVKWHINGCKDTVIRSQIKSLELTPRTRGRSVAAVEAESSKLAALVRRSKVSHADEDTASKRKRKESNTSQKKGRGEIADTFDDDEEDAVSSPSESGSEEAGSPPPRVPAAAKSSSSRDTRSGPNKEYVVSSGLRTKNGASKKYNTSLAGLSLDEPPVTAASQSKRGSAMQQSIKQTMLRQAGGSMRK